MAQGFDIGNSRLYLAVPNVRKPHCPPHRDAVHLPSRSAPLLLPALLSAHSGIRNSALPLLIYGTARCPIERERRRILQLLILRLHEAPDAPPFLAPAAVVQGQLLTMDIKIIARVGLSGETILDGVEPAQAISHPLAACRHPSSSRLRCLLCMYFIFYWHRCRLARVAVRND